MGDDSAARDVTMPALTHKLAVMAIKQYALVLQGIRDSCSTAEARASIHQTMRSTVELAELVEDCATPPATGRETGE